jgi:hypothetical protein
VEFHIPQIDPPAKESLPDKAALRQPEGRRKAFAKLTQGGKLLARAVQP